MEEETVDTEEAETEVMTTEVEVTEVEKETTAAEKEVMEAEMEVMAEVVVEVQEVLVSVINLKTEIAHMVTDVDFPTKDRLITTDEETKQTWDRKSARCVNVCVPFTLSSYLEPYLLYRTSPNPTFVTQSTSKAIFAKSH